MIETISITDANVIESIRSSMPTADMKTKGLMPSSDRMKSYSWGWQPGPDKVLYVGRFSRESSIAFSAISGNNASTVTSVPTPLIIAINNHAIGGMKTAKIGSEEKWAYIDDGKYINLYYLCCPYVGDGIYIISYSTVELILEFVDAPSGLVSI